jgi:hypothetical protein
LSPCLCELRASTVCNYTRCNHEAAVECECEAANCTCCSKNDHDVNVVKNEQEIQEMETVKKFGPMINRLGFASPVIFTATLIV